MYTIELKPLIQILELCLLRKVTLEEISLKSSINLNTIKRISKNKEANITLKNLDLLTSYFVRELRIRIPDCYSNEDIYYSVMIKLIRIERKPIPSIFSSVDLLDTLLKEYIGFLQNDS